MRRIVVFGLLCSLSLVVGAQDEKKAVQRVRLPEFTRSQADSVFFPNVFDRLNGDRPSSPNATVASATPGGTGEASGAGSEGGDFAWSKIISPTTLEDEVKAIKKRIDESVTTPSDFAGRGHKVARREFTMLSVAFAIINDYDADVRWKDNASIILSKFARTASNTKAGGNRNVFNEAKARQQDLEDLLRGSRLTGDEADFEDWGEIADRAPLMQRLESAHQKSLTPWTSSEDSFNENIELVLHEAELVAAMAEILTQEGMEDGDDEDYASFADRMKKGALDIAAAVKLSNHEQARQGNAEITKACSECHELYR